MLKKLQVLATKDLGGDAAAKAFPVSARRARATATRTTSARAPWCVAATTAPGATTPTTTLTTTTTMKTSNTTAARNPKVHRITASVQAVAESTHPFFEMRGSYITM